MKKILDLETIGGFICCVVTLVMLFFIICVFY